MERFLVVLWLAVIVAALLMELYKISPDAAVGIVAFMAAFTFVHEAIKEDER